MIYSFALDLHHNMDIRCLEEECFGFCILLVVLCSLTVDECALLVEMRGHDLSLFGYFRSIQPVYFVYSSKLSASRSPRLCVSISSSSDRPKISKCNDGPSGRFRTNGWRSGILAVLLDASFCSGEFSSRSIISADSGCVRLLITDTLGE